MTKLRIKKGDTVRVLSGKDKGKTGKVIAVFPKIGKLTVEGVNMHTKFERARNTGGRRQQPAQRIQVNSPLYISKVQLVDSNSGKPSRVGFQKLENGNKQRIAKKSGKAV